MDAFQAFKDTHEILATISAYVDLERSGSVWQGICPFHSERTPSFTVYPDTQSYYCFGCDRSGDVITFLAKYQECTPREVIGLRTLPAPVTLHHPEPPVTRPAFAFTGENVLQWHQTLLAHHDDLLDYLRGRGIDDQRIASAPLGTMTMWGKRWITIPHFVCGQLVGVKLRHDPFVEHDKTWRYRSMGDMRGHLFNQDVAIAGWFPVVVTGAADDSLSDMMDGIDFAPGMSHAPLLYLSDSELDALAIWSLTNNPGVVAVPDGGFKAHHARLVATADALVFVTDNDENGTGERATNDAIALCGRGEMVMPPRGKDVCEYVQMGGTDISWLL